MDSKVGYTIGGFAAGITSVAVIGLVALSNSAILADSDAVPAGGALVLAAAPVASTAPARAESVTPPSDTAADAVDETAPVATEPQAPVVESPVVPQASDTEPVEPVQQAPLAPAKSVSTPALDAAVAAGAWDVVREWCVQHGWSSERINAWLDDLRADRAPGASVGDPTSWPAQTTSDRWGTIGSAQDDDRRAEAPGSSDTRSRVSPDRRDR